MAGPWEVVLHHDYRGVPGVVFDQSPGRAAHGRLRNLTASDFRVDGRSPGSGALHFRGGDSGVRVALQRPWKVLRGIIVQFACTQDVVLNRGTLLDSDSFTLESRPPILRLKLKTAIRATEVTMNVRDLGGQWITLSASYENQAGLHYAGALGEGLVNDGLFQGFLLPISQLTIGNRLGGGDGVTGLIDDVRILRIDPQQIDKNFQTRPVDPAVSTCWDDWIRTMIRTLKDDRECAAVIMEKLTRAQNAILAAVGTAATSAQFLAAAQAYARHWKAGRLDEIPAEVVAATDFLKSHGIDMASSPELSDLIADPCFRRLVEKMPPLNCDPAFTTMVTGIGEGL